MKKFTQYLKPEQKPTKEQPKTIVDQAWSNARKKIEEKEKLNQLAIQEETKKQEELKKKQEEKEKMKVLGRSKSMEDLERERDERIEERKRL